ncbi:hypothetical protein BC332_15526 [Capsicum chinense]|nr:hypothetical protein BC332_15526 [Capsicum chinense]
MGIFMLFLVKVEIRCLFLVLSFGQVGAEDKAVLDKIVDSLTSLANSSNSLGSQDKENNISLKVGVFQETIMDKKCDAKVLILGAGRVCRPAAKLLGSIGSMLPNKWLKSSITADFEEQNCVQVIVGSLYLKDTEKVIKGIPNAKAIQLDITNHESLSSCIAQDPKFAENRSKHRNDPATMKKLKDKAALIPYNPKKTQNSPQNVTKHSTNRKPKEPSLGQE